MEITDLTGVGDKTADELRDCGYVDIETIAKTSAMAMANRTSIGENKAEKIIDAARDVLEDGGEIITGLQAKKNRDKQGHVSTGSRALDELLLGGIRTNYITEFHGKSSSGKSQIAHQLAVNVQLPDHEVDFSDEDDWQPNGLEGECLYIDAEDTFMPERIEQMAEGVGLDPDEVLSNIHVAEAKDSGHQQNLAQKGHMICANNNIRLIVVDSIIANYRADYSGRGELADRQSELNSHLKTLKQLASTFDCAVYITNQVMEDPGQMFGNPLKPVGGNVLAHASTVRIWIRSKKDSKVARMVDSTMLPPGEVEYQITDDGIRDV